MNLLKNIRLSKIIQDKNRNRAAFNCLREIGFPVGDIRTALLKMNGIKVRQLAGDVTAPTIHKTIGGERHNATAMDILSTALDVPKSDLFPDNGNHGG